MSKYITAYTGGTAISGFTNIGNIAVDTNPGSGNYALGNFVGGVLDSYDTSGYVVISDNTTAGVVGWSTGNNTGTASANTPIFWVSPTKDDVGFLYLINRLPARYGQSLFTIGSDAKTWLNNNGYWTSWSPSIITSGLILNLDAGNSTSYPGTGTTWYDLVGNNDGTLVNNPSFSLNNGGIIIFDGVNDNVSILNNITTNFTIGCWIKTTANSLSGSESYEGNGIIWSDVGGPANDFVLAILNNRASWFTGDVGSSINGTTTLNNGKWYYLTVTKDSLTNTKELFVNAQSEGTGPSTGSILNSNPNIKIGGNTGDSRYFDGSIPIVQIYDRVLSTAEILQNFNATKSRFTLTISTNSGGGLNGWNATAFDIAPNPEVGTTYPVGSQITFQNGEVRTMVQVDDYGYYMDIFYDSPISTGILFPIIIG